MRQIVEKIRCTDQEFAECLDMVNAGHWGVKDLYEESHYSAAVLVPESASERALAEAMLSLAMGYHIGDMIPMSCDSHGRWRWKHRPKGMNSVAMVIVHRIPDAPIESDSIDVILINNLGHEVDPASEQGRPYCSLWKAVGLVSDDGDEPIPDRPEYEEDTSIPDILESLPGP